MQAPPTVREMGEISPTRIRTAVAGFRVLSANHYTMGELIYLQPAQAVKMEMQGIDPCTSRMLSERSTI